MYAHGTEAKIVTNMSVFGDGNHESTQVVLDALYESSPKGKKVLDIGTGTGIQSIFAKLWGADDVLAVDIEFQAINIARGNFYRNNVEVVSRLNIYNEMLDFKADITIANLPAHCIKEYLTTAQDTMKEDGILICSFPTKFNIENECDLTNYVIKKRLKGLEYDAFILEKKI